MILNFTGNHLESYQHQCVVLSKSQLLFNTHTLYVDCD